MNKLIKQNDITSARLLMTSTNPEDVKADKIFLIRSYFAQVRNTKKAAQLIKEFELDLKTIDSEFYEIEEVVINESMNFYMQQFGVSFKHYSMQNVLRLADYLVDHGPQKYGKPLAFLIEKLVKHDNLDEAKHIFDLNKSMVEKHIMLAMAKLLKPKRICFKYLA